MYYFSGDIHKVNLGITKETHWAWNPLTAGSVSGTASDWVSVTVSITDMMFSLELRKEHTIKHKITKSHDN